MFNRSSRLSFVVITDHQATIPDEIKRFPKGFIHLAVHNDGERQTITSSEYHGGALIQSIQKTFPAAYTAGFQTFFYSMCRRVANEGLLIYQHSPELYESFCVPFLTSQLPYLIWADDANSTSFKWRTHHFVANALARFAFSETGSRHWRSNLVFDCDQIEQTEFSAYLKTCLDARNNHQNFEHDSADDQNVLLVSYYADPAQTVATHRIRYWHEKLPEVAQNNGLDLSVALLTATHSFKPRKNVIYVPDLAKLNCYADQNNELTEQLDAARVNSFASYWSAHVRNWFENHPNMKFDSVILSGNPFYYFDLGEYFKQKWDAKVILDFRDPFANNPRFKYTEEHKKIATRLEQDYIKNSDFALSVNHFCVDLLCLDETEKGIVIANGYEEEVADSVDALPRRSREQNQCESGENPSSDKTDRSPRNGPETIGFVYTGSFYADRDAEPFLQQLDPKRHELIHIGRSAPSDVHLDNYAAIHRYGLMPYSEVLAYCKSMDAGIIFTSGAAFEQTTKIFDYIAADIDIIIVTNGEMKTGELHRLTKDMSGIYWVENTSTSISKFLNSYRPSARKRKNRHLYSRLHQTQKLYELLVAP